MAFTQITISQDFNAADWTEPSGTVTFTPVVPMLNSVAATGARKTITFRYDGTKWREIARA